MTIDYLEHLRADSTRFVEVLRAADPAARVPSCPEWNADDLLWHLSEVFLFWTTVVRDRLDDPAPADAAEPERPADHAGLLTLYDRAATELVATLAATADDVPVWTWSGDDRVGFVRRRMAHEALIHRLDAELTAGAPTGLDAELASDGVLEALQHFYGGHPRWAGYRGRGPIGRLRATDTGDEWLVELGGFSGLSPTSGRTYTDEPTLELLDAGTATFTLSASARDLDAWLWNRPTLTDPTVDGDDADFRAFAAHIANGVN